MVGSEEPGRNTVELAKTFGSIAKKMLIDFEHQRTSVKHRGLKGKAREITLVKEYLVRYLPQNLRILQNVEIVATDGSVSGECDIAICDASTPPLWTTGDVSVIPIECVYAVVEVKSDLDSTELLKSLTAITAIKTMPKTAYIRGADGGLPDRMELYGQRWGYFPTLGFIFGFESIQLRTLVSGIIAFVEDNSVSPERRLDGVYVLSKGIVLWNNPDTKQWLTAEPGPIGLQTVATDEQAFLAIMTLHLQSLLQSPFMPPFHIGAYMGNLKVGRRDFYSSSALVTSPAATTPGPVPE